MRLGKHSAIVAALVVSVPMAFLAGCVKPGQPGKPVKPGLTSSGAIADGPPSSQRSGTPSVVSTRGTAPAGATGHVPGKGGKPPVKAPTSKPATAASRPATGSQPAVQVRGPAPEAPEGSTSTSLLPRDMPGHPFMMFNKADIQAVAKRKGQDPLMQECWDKMVALAAKPDQLDEWWEQLEARALVAVVTNDKEMARKAIDLMQAGLKKTDPDQFYEIGAANFGLHAAPLRALGLGWDWLFGYMTPQERGAILPQLEHWCDSCLTSTNKRWWREASYNVGAIPIGGLGILALAIHGDSAHPSANLWLRETTRRISQNYFTNCWKPSGICYEGPNYAIFGLKYPALFAEALRRAGGRDIAGEVGTTVAIQYLMHQWMPQGACAPIGDNTNYGKRTFGAEYLLGIARSKDAVGLWTWRSNLDSRYIDPLIMYLWYPLDLRPVGPVAAEAPAAKYFEVTPNRAGYFFSRTKWQDPDAAFFSFVTRYERCNHEHYDMDSFLFGAYGTLFATHEMLFPYGNANHGVDFEHNMIIVDEGGWPRHDSDSSCGDDNSTDGLLVGLATGPFADYVRGDAKWSYRDNSIVIDNPAIRAERACLFVKAGATPYLLAFDDIQFSDDEHLYKWQWHAPTSVTVSGKGTVGEPLVLAAKKGSCAIQFVVPQMPVITTEKAPNLARKPEGGSLQRIIASQKGIRVRYAAIATLQETPEVRPIVSAQPVACESESAGAAQVKMADGLVDQIVWQSEEMGEQRGSPLSAGALQTDGLVAVVRVKGDEVVGYVLGEGSYLKYGDKVLVMAKDSVCVTADAEGAKVFGRRQARKGLPAAETGEVKTFKVGKAE